MTTQNPKDRVGDENAGFSMGEDPLEGAFSVRAWGFWSVEVATAFGLEVVAALRRRPGPKRLVLDFTDLKPMREEGQRSLAHVLRSLPSVGITGISIVTASHLTKLQLVRIATESGAGNQVEWLGAKPEATRNA